MEMPVCCGKNLMSRGLLRDFRQGRKRRVMHSISFDNAYNDWNEALPMGNGVFGGMVYFRDYAYTTAMNHYEVYYSIHERPGAQAGLSAQLGECREHYLQSAVEKTRNCETDGFLHYRKTIWPDADTVKDAPLHMGMSHPPTGEFSILLNRSEFSEDRFRLQLDIEDAQIRLQAGEKERQISIMSKVLVGRDIILTDIRQTVPGLISAVEVTYPQRRNHEGHTWQFFQTDRKTFGFQAAFRSGKRIEEQTEQEAGKENPCFRFCVYFSLDGAEAEMEVRENKMLLHLKNQEKEIRLLTHVLTELQSRNLPVDGSKNIRAAEAALSEELDSHRIHWSRFFQKAGIQIPDQLLEKLWYLNLYILECCSGRGGKRYEHACGLNGLWDIRQPTLWGSMWYWDVNIQSAFWGVYTSNHMELAQAFNDGLLYYAEEARRMAKSFYRIDGYAMDYPHKFYNCILPWCAQHLWWYYEYTLDLEFLREKAYPFFKNVLCFVRQAVQIDPETRTWYLFPDVSPEQGPITRNSTITIAAVKYLLRISIRANELLGEAEEDREMFSELLQSCPDYPLAGTGRYGTILRDSELSPPALKLRHPSLLMPVFPVGEMTQYSADRERAIAEHTVRFASEHTELGVFPFGWIASAAARVGAGNMALRVLYEQGLDLVLRANGMGAEETDRWINHCPAELGMGQLYYPCMMECVGGIVSAVNEMLLQSHDGIVHVFPAVPDGDEEAWRKRYRQEPLVERAEKKTVKWEDCSFSNLLAKGGFEVSADMRKGSIVFLQVRSLRGGMLRLDVKEPVSAVVKNGRKQEFDRDEKGYLAIKTKAGAVYQVLFGTDVYSAARDTAEEKRQRYHTGISYVNHFGRRVFCGKNRYSDTIRTIDSFLFDYYVSNDRYRNMTVYRFSFGAAKQEMKQIKSPFYEPALKVEKDFLKLTKDLEYEPGLGFGFAGEQMAVETEDTGRGNVLLQDLVRGRGKVSFLTELPKGIYEFLAVSGGSREASATRIAIRSGSTAQTEAEIRTAKDDYGTGILLAVHSSDGIVKLDLETEPGLCWSLNLLIIKKITAF